MTSFQTVIEDHRRQLIKADRQVSSDRKQVGIPVEVDIVNSQLRDNESSFFSPDEDGPCPRCEYEEGRSEADKRYHQENCL